MNKKQLLNLEKNAYLSVTELRKTLPELAMPIDERLEKRARRTAIARLAGSSEKLRKVAETIKLPLGATPDKTKLREATLKALREAVAKDPRLASDEELSRLKEGHSVFCYGFTHEGDALTVEDKLEPGLTPGKIFIITAERSLPGQPSVLHVKGDIPKFVYGSPVANRKAEADETEVKHWTDLPTFVASDIFRDLILTRTLDNLFRPTDDQIFPQAELRADFSERVRNDSVLNERGIRVLSADFGKLNVPAAVEMQRLNSWKADWIRQSAETLAGFIRTRRIIGARSR